MQKTTEYGAFLCVVNVSFKGIVKNVGKGAYSFSWQELDVKIPLSYLSDKYEAGARRWLA